MGAEHRSIVETAEAFADGLVTVADLQRASDSAKRHFPRFLGSRDELQIQGATESITVLRTGFVRTDLHFGGYEAAHGVIRAVINILGDAPRELEVAGLLRDIVGNPFRPVTLNPAWRTSNVTGLAQAIYDDRAFDRLPILADALEDAGCDNADILNHCRDGGVHVRGCWVVDLVLGKQ
jgi:hypothetical protein